MNGARNGTSGGHALTEQEHSTLTSVILIVMAIIIAIENATVCLLFATFEKLRTTTNIFVVSLAVSDLLVGVLFVPVYLTSSVGHEANLYIVTFLLFSSLFNLCGVTYDRYHAILQPLTYVTVLTCRRITMILMAVWFFPVVFISVPFTWSSQDALSVITVSRVYLGLMVSTVFFTCVVITKVYFSIFKAIRRQLKMTQHVNNMFEPFSSTSVASVDSKSPLQWRTVRESSESCELTPPGPESPRIDCTSQAVTMPFDSNEGNVRKALSCHLKKLRFKKHSESLLNDIRAAKLFAVIILIFIICWLPVVVINFMLAIDRVMLIPNFIFDISVYAFVGNALVNPLLYTFYKSDFRLALFDAITMRRQKRRQFNVSTDFLELAAVNLN